QMRGADALEKFVDFQWAAGALAMHDGEGVEVHPMSLEDLQSAQHFVEGGAAALVHTIEVVEFARAVDAQADEKLFSMEEFTPGVVQEDSVGLESIGDLPAVPVPFLQRDGLGKELHPHERGLPALPDEQHLGPRWLCFDLAAHIRLQHLRCHPAAAR